MCYILYTQPVKPFECTYFEDICYLLYALFFGIALKILGKMRYTILYLRRRILQSSVIFHGFVRLIGMTGIRNTEESVSCERDRMWEWVTGRGV